MKFKDLQAHWTKLGHDDPMWAALSDDRRKGGRWTVEEFYAEGRREIGEALAFAKSAGLNITLGRALDFGCGPGRLSQGLAGHFNEVHGVDISPTMIETARKYNQHGEKCLYHVNGAADLRLFPDAHFDFIYSSMVLQHMNHELIRGYLREFVRLLRPQGALVFQLPSHRPEESTPSPSKPDDRSAVRKAASGLYYGLKEAWWDWRVRRIQRSQLRKGEAVYEMYGITPNDIESLFTGAGARVVAQRQDPKATPWIGFMYCVARAGANSG